MDNKKSKKEKADKIINEEFDKANKKEDQIDEQIENQFGNQIDTETNTQTSEQTNTENTAPQPVNISSDATNSNKNQEDLINALNIPMEEVKYQPNEQTDPNAPDTDYEFQGRDKNENLDDEDDLLGEDEILEDDLLFDDYKLMSELGVELLDLVATSGAMLVAKDWGNDEKYAVSEARKRKIRKPLELLLKKKGKKVPPEIMFFFTIAVIYAPLYVKAFQERATKKREALDQNVEVMENVPDFNIRRNQPEVVVPQPPPVMPQADPVEEKPKEPKKRGKDKKPRKNKNYKGNKNAKR